MQTWPYLFTFIYGSRPMPKKPERRKLRHPFAPESCTMKTFAPLAAALMFLLGAATVQALSKVTFLTSWCAEAEHGGYYPTVANGIYVHSRQACIICINMFPVS